MALTVKHSKTSAIPDAGDATLVQPSDWNADHTLTGTVPVANGGTGATTANDGLNALLPTQTGNNGKVLSTDGTNTSWLAVGGSGTVTSVGTGTGLSGGPITGSGTINFSNANVATWAATPSSANLAAAVSDETGSGSLVFGTSPTLSTPTISGGTINNASIGATTRSSGDFTTLSANTVTSTTPVLSFNAANAIASFGSTTANSYNQLVIQNKSGTTSASTNYVLSNDLGTDSTYYGEFGMNSSGYSSGTPSDFFSLNNGVYFSSHDGDVSVGSGNGYKTYFAWGTSGNHAHVINASGAIGLDTNITGTTNFGTAGQVLTSQGSGATPTWTTVSGGGSPAGSNTQLQFNNSGSFGASSALTWNGTTLKSTNLEATGGALADGAFSGTYVDGIVMDYDSVGSAGRISVGGADSLKFYNGGVAGSLLGSIANNGDWSIAQFLDIGNGTLIGGATNPVLAAAASANNYVQVYNHNDLAGTSASADLIVYPDNGTDSSGWLDMGITSSNFSDAAYTVTGNNEGYLFMSALSGSGKTGNLIYATDSTGTTNAHQWYVGGFAQSKSAYKMQLGSSALDLKTTINLNGSAGTSGQVLTSAGAGSIPTWTTPTTGTVTSVAALTLGTTGTDLSSSVATGTTTPVITLNVPTASAANRGALSSTDWSTFNGKQAALVSGTNIKTINGSTLLGSGDLTVSAAAGGSNTQVQYNSSGALTGSANLVFDGTTLTPASVVIPASAGSIAPLKLTSGTNLATAQAGAMEFDGSVPYFSTAASTRGIMRNEQYVILNSTYTLTSQTAAQKLFNASTNGAITLPIGTHYFECFFSLSTMSATTGSFGFAMVAGTAVIGSQGWMSIAEKGTATLTTATAGQLTYSTAANTALTTTSTNTVGYALIRGTIKITTAGTVIPSVSLGVASAAVVGINSYFKTYPISGTAAANITVGNWS